MSQDSSMTDDDIRAVFERRAARAYEGDLRESILRVTATSRRTAGWARRVRTLLDLRDVPRALVIAMVATALMTVAFAAGGLGPPAPDATPTPGSSLSATPIRTIAPHRAAAPLFELPFEYIVPAGTSLQVAESDRIYSFTEVLALGPDQGVTVVRADQVFVHPCPSRGSGSREEVRSAPAELLDDLRTIAGLDIGDPQSTMLAGNTALSATLRVDDPGCQPADIHPGPGGIASVSLGVPSRLIVAEVRGTTILVQVWAGSERALAEWLPVAMEFVDSIEFVPAP